MKIENTKKCIKELKSLGYIQKSINVIFALEIKDTNEIKDVPVNKLKKVRGCGKVTVENLQNPNPNKSEKKIVSNKEKEREDYQSKRWKEECQRRDNMKKKIGDFLKTYDAEKLILYIEFVEGEFFDSACFEDLENHKNKISKTSKTREMKVLLGYIYFIEYLKQKGIPFERFVAVESRGDIGFYRSIHVTLEGTPFLVMFHVTTDDDFGRVAIRVVKEGEQWVCRDTPVSNILKDFSGSFWELGGN